MHKVIIGEFCRDLVALLSQRPATLPSATQITGQYNGFDRLCEAAKVNTMTNQPPYYRIYLLTVWQERSRGPPESTSWRFRLEDPRSGQQQLFVDAAGLMIALCKLAEHPSDAAIPKGSEE